jgi:hypothetical protein
MVAASLHANSWAQNIHGVLGIHEIGQYLKIWHAIERTAFTNELDHLKLKLTASGTYSGQSCYLSTFHGSATCHAWKLVWKSWRSHE